MAFIVYSYATRETATSYISTDELDSIFASNYFLDESKISSLTEAEKENLLVAATNICDKQFNPFLEDKFNSEQRLEFPRDFEEFEDETNTSIDEDIKTFICFLVEQLITDSSIFTASYSTNNSTAQVKKVKLDALEKEYFENKTFDYNLSLIEKINSYAANLIYPYQDLDLAGFSQVSISRS